VIQWPVTSLTAFGENSLTVNPLSQRSRIPLEATI
jgi:hypothetical protein